MVSTSKILTVSYGTFSCTLEGFDDSFDTMKAIAEYFRDLAADDRYFGAEPPTPDAEMLARIAERELSRRVEARQESGSIVLRPSADAGQAQVGHALSAAAVAAPAMAPVVQSPSVDSEEPAEQSQQSDAADIGEAPEESTHEDSAYLAEDGFEAEEITSDAVEEEQAEALHHAIEDAEDEPSEDYAADDYAFEAEDTEMDDVEDVPARTASVPHPDENSIAAKLQRIRAVVSRTEDQPEVAEDNYSEDEHAEDFLNETNEALEEALLQDDQAEEAQDEDAQTLADFLAQTNPAAETEADEDAAEAVADYEAPAAEVREEADEEDDVAGLLDRLASLSPDADEAEEAPEPDTDLAQAQDIAETVEEAMDEDLDAVEAATEPAPAPLRARVVKMKRADFEAAIAEGHLEATDELEEDDDWDDEDDAWDALEDTSLSPEEEAELQRELAQVAAETSAEAQAEDEDDLEEVESIFAETPDDDPIPQTRRVPREQLDQAGNERDMTRLMAKTISEMDEPESANRRNAIAHLRAAVAATRADKQAGVTARDDTIGNAFRDDLASVVRPRRPRSEGGQTARPADPQRSAPLKLVAEQRVDAAAPIAPVRPRRVSVSEMAQEQAAAEEAALSQNDMPNGSFAEYAETMGAQELPDILEAAAAFLSFVEGRDQFSRPQLMTRARSAIGPEFSREDGLRSFGQLLRQGKIQKIKGGRFTVSEEIGFQPSERRAG